MTLSDHTAHQLALAAEGRRAALAGSIAERNRVLAARNALRLARRAALAAAWRGRAWLSAALALWRLLFGPLPAVPPRPAPPPARRDELVWAAGQEGERRVAARLAAVLDDTWTLVCGYRNVRGEIDQILVGPGGMLALEIKAINGVVHCDGDHWWRDKFDRYGNLVERGLEIADQCGRGPSRQLNEPVDVLQEFLQIRFGNARIERAVILAHEQSRVGVMKALAVDGVCTLAEWDIGALAAAPFAAGQAAPARLVDAIAEHHARHGNRGRRRPPEGPAAEVAARRGRPAVGTANARRAPRASRIS
jgi:hypothetical protein